MTSSPKGERKNLQAMNAKFVRSAAELFASANDSSYLEALVHEATNQLRRFMTESESKEENAND